MATYVKETNKGRTFHLLRLDTPVDGETVFLDATHRVNEAFRRDKEMGYSKGGPRVGQEVEKAREYADYVAEHASLDQLYQFKTKDYLFFTDNKTNSTTNGSNVSVE